MVLAKVISGGQTGVDRAALRAALHNGLDIGGWCPPGREADDGAIPDSFPLVETPRERSDLAPEVPRSLRTEWNVRDADATLVFKFSDRGSVWTQRAAVHYQKPVFICRPDDDQAVAIIDWINIRKPTVLNVAGPSEKNWPGIGDRVYALLVEVFLTVGGGQRQVDNRDGVAFP